MKAYVGIGSNLGVDGDRKLALERAARELRAIAPDARFSPIYENPAVTPPGAPFEWRIPFLNAAAEFTWPGAAEPSALLAQLKKIERAIGRADGARWSPRAIDLDLLALGDQRLATDSLTLPHRDLWDRSFVIDPLKDLAPNWTPPGQTKTVLERARELRGHAPLWMGVLNLTPDSFSDGGRLPDPDAVAARIEEFARAGVHAVDVGGESTRPGSSPVDAAEEWSRIAPALELLRARFKQNIFGPIVSVDTFRPETAERALAAGADWINDVNGARDERLLEIVREAGCGYVLMHSLTAPADRSVTISPDADPVAEIKLWAWSAFARLDRAGIDLGRVIFDPGIGFGKTPAQSLAILRRAREFADLPTRTLIGHSRKSFMRLWTKASPAKNDLETIGASLQLAEQGIDFLRVHEPAMHARVYRAYQESAPWNA